MPDGWIYESPCGCVLHEKNPSGHMGLLLTIGSLIVPLSRVCPIIKAVRLTDDPIGHNRMMNHVALLLYERESELCNESFTY